MKYSEQDAIEAVQEAAEKLGHSPSISEYNELDILPSGGAIRKRWGWNSLKEKAGLTIKNPYNDKITTPYISNQGYLTFGNYFNGERFRISLHRLVVVAEYGFDEIVDKEVHHKNGIPWDNRPCNLKPLTPSEHAKLHMRERHGRNEPDVVSEGQSEITSF